MLPSSSTTAFRSGFAPADAAQAVLFPEKSSPISPAMQQLFDATKELKRDFFGTVIRGLGQQAKDIRTALFSITQEELDNPLVRGHLMSLGINPDNLKPTARMNDVLLAQQKTAALVAGIAAGMATGGVAGLAIRGAFGTGALGAAATGTAEAAAFGATFGAILPVEDGQTRAGNVLTNTVLSAPFGAAGGLVSHTIRSALRARGIDPHLEAPETVPDPVPAPDGPTLGDRARGLVGSEDIPIPREPTRVITPEAPARPTPEAPVVSARDRILAAFDYEGPSRPKMVLRDVADKVYSGVFDNTFPINRLTKNLLKEQEAAGVSRGAAPREAVRSSVGSLDEGIFPDDPAAVALDPTSLTPNVRLPGIDDPTILADLVKSSVARATQFVEANALDYATSQAVGPGLKDIVRGVEQAGKSLDLDAALVSPRTIQLAERGIKTDIPLDAAVEFLRTGDEGIAQVADAVFKFNDQVLQYEIDSGFVPPELGEMFREMNRQFVPLPKVLDDAIPGMAGGPKSSQRLGNLPPTKAIKGGKGQRIPPIEATIRNTYFAVEMSHRYAVVDAIVRLAERIPESKYVKFLGEDIDAAGTKALAEKMAANFLEDGTAPDAATAQRMADATATIMPSPRANTFWVWRGGKKLYVELDPTVTGTLLNLDREMLGPLTKFLSVPASIQRIGFTALSPAFGPKNVFRDFLGATAFSRFGWKPPIDVVHGTLNAFGRGDLLDAYRRSGAEHATISRLLLSDRVASRSSVRRIMEGKGTVSELFRDAVRSPLSGSVELARSLADLSEIITRSPEFSRAMAATGGDSFRSAFAARDLLNFSRAGSALRTANSLIPFLNVQLQDLDKFGRTVFAEGSSRRNQALLKAAAGITAPTMSLYLLNRGDPHYEELSEAQKDFFWNIPNYKVQAGEDGATHLVRNERFPFIKIPSLTVPGTMFKAIPERVMRWLDTQDPTAFEDMGKNVLQGLTPPLMPGILGPGLDATSGPGGFDRFRQRPIVPLREQRLIKEEQAGVMQRETVRLIGRALNKSPRKVEFVLNGYSGGIAKTVLQVSDEVLKRAGIASAPASGIQEGISGVPVLSQFAQAFLSREPDLGSASVTRFERNRDEVERMMATVRTLGRDPERIDDMGHLIDTFPDMLVAYGAFLKISEAMDKHRERIYLLRARKEIPLAEREELIREQGSMLRLWAAAGNDIYKDIRKSFRANLEGIQPVGGIGATITPRQPRP